MTEKNLIIDPDEYWDGYPVTVVSDRYDGAYSRGKWTAWPLDRDEVPDEIDADDSIADDFWSSQPHPVGIGQNPSEAYDDLLKKMNDLKGK